MRGSMQCARRRAGLKKQARPSSCLRKLSLSASICSRSRGKEVLVLAHVHVDAAADRTTAARGTWSVKADAAHAARAAAAVQQ